MTTTSGRDALETHAPEHAPLLARLDAGAWQSVQVCNRVDLFDLASQAVALQHGLPTLERPSQLGASPWTKDYVAQWRKAHDLEQEDRATLHLAEQFAFNVASTQADQREAYFAALQGDAVVVAQAIYAADLVPRSRAALDSLFGTSDWSNGSQELEPELAAVIDDVIRTIPALQGIDPVVTELVRLLGARRHACRVCQSVRSYSAMEAGAGDEMFDAVENYDAHDFSDAQKAALAFADGFLASPARFESAAASTLRKNFDPAACVELVLDMMRNATNKLAVALGGDAPRVETGYEVYDVKANGEIEYGLTAP